ncbi:uncharacterized protein ARMOST_16036 [Armillaria ostoyae]|uniref:Uncharacterized protein n=1 Tax=Armillaria ostoyae TaxID=47428 RepID=A0A284RV14_ARMOS|nr:uncharacterized protein ARMOST_16036 [Armillaria ostoyae]
MDQVRLFSVKFAATEHGELVVSSSLETTFLSTPYAVKPERCAPSPAIGEEIVYFLASQYHLTFPEPSFDSEASVFIHQLRNKS